MTYHCGPGWVPQWIKKIFSYKFNEQCKYHDDMYARQEVKRKMADEIFLIEMKMSSKGLWRLVAYIYWVLVRCFGWISWRKNGQK